MGTKLKEIDGMFGASSWQGVTCKINLNLLKYIPVLLQILLLTVVY